jgi:hypothetical protein
MSRLKKELEIFNSLLNIVRFQKTILVHEGEMCNFEAFVIIVSEIL